MRKLIKLFLPCLLLVGCSNTPQKLSDIYDEDEIIKLGLAEVEIINTMDYDAIISTIKLDLQAELSAADLELAWGEVLSNLGAFEECPNTQVIGTNNPETKEELATIALQCKYENGSATYTLTYDQELDLVGLYMK